MPLSRYRCERKLSRAKAQIREDEAEIRRQQAEVVSHLAKKGYTIPPLTKLTESQLDEVEGLIATAREELGFECVHKPDTSNDSYSYSERAQSLGRPG